MKSFNEHTNVKREELKESDPFDDLTDLLWVAAAGAGLWGLSKGWDRFGKDAVASLPFATKGMKAAKIDRAKERKDKKVDNAKKIADDPKSSAKDKEEAEKDLDKLLSPAEKAERETEKKDKEKGDTEKIEKGKVASGEYSVDDEGIIDNQADAQKYKDATKSAPEGWVTSKGREGEPAKGIVWTTADQEKRDDVEAKKKEKEKEDNQLEPKGTKMTITESNELQAIMALDDVGIKAEINRKGQVVIKKKDKKKAHRALEKSFTKGGWPTLKLEDIELDEALKPLDKSVIDAFYYRKEKAGNVVSTDGDSLNKIGMGGQTIAQWLKPSGKIAISAVTDVKSTESILKYMKKSIPKGNFDKKSYKKFFGEEIQKPRTAYEVVSEARSKIMEVADEYAARELYLFMQNERDLQRQKDSIIKNIVRKKKSDKYDHSKAPKLWSYWVDNGAKAYDKEFSSPGAKTFDKDTRQSVAIQFANEYNVEIDLGNYS